MTEDEKEQEIAEEYSGPPEQSQFYKALHPPKPPAWGCDSYTYNREEIEYLVECFKLNGGVISKVLACALSNLMFFRFKTAEDAQFIVWLIENREYLLKLTKGEIDVTPVKFELKKPIHKCQPHQ